MGARSSALSHPAVSVNSLFLEQGHPSLSACTRCPGIISRVGGGRPLSSWENILLGNFFCPFENKEWGSYPFMKIKSWNIFHFTTQNRHTKKLHLCKKCIFFSKGRKLIHSWPQLISCFFFSKTMRRMSLLPELKELCSLVTINALLSVVRRGWRGHSKGNLEKGNLFRELLYS